MELNGGNLRSTEFTARIDVMNIIAGHRGKGAAHVADDSRLPTVVDLVIAHQMAAHSLPIQPLRTYSKIVSV